MSEELNKKLHKWLGKCFHIAGDRHPELPVDLCSLCGKQLWGTWKEIPEYDSDPVAMVALIDAVRAQGYAAAFGMDSVKFSAEVYSAFTKVADQEFRAEAGAMPEALALAVEKLIDAERAEVAE